MQKEDYGKLLKDNISKAYKKSSGDVKKDIDKEASGIAKQLKLEERMEKYANRNAYITLKDHKDNFINSPKCRLINPAKSEVGLVSKKILERINTDIRNATKSNQWRNTASVISWFTKIENKDKSKFLKFDIVDYYPSISLKLLEDSLKFAQKFTNISQHEIEIILHSRKSLLFENEQIYTKKGDELFDVTMGSYDGAEVTDLVGLFLLGDLESLLGKENVGLYRDDGLASLISVSGPQADRIRKQLIKCFKDHGLEITVDTNLQVTEFLDVVLDLRNGKYHPYRKPNDTPLYIHAESNHPPSVTKQLPKMISRRISDISCNEEEFNKAKGDYDEALAKSGYRDKIKYEETHQRKKNRKRNILWFNPPFSANVKTNVGKRFMSLVQKHFPPHHQYRSLFNKNNVKVSYSCVENMGNVIQSHNGKILNQQKPKEEKSCNCRVKSSCPLDGSCRKACIVYKATVTSGASTKLYYGASEGDFKQRYYNHTKSFLHTEYRTETELSEYIWNLKNQNKQFKIAWSIAATSSPYRAGSRRCDLCLTEKLIIAKADPETLLNSRAELVSKCRHSNKFSLKKL
jgi:hypothetical protein